MKQAVFITGFNNWGKSCIIGDLFDRSHFYHKRTYPIIGVNFETQFTVETHSNDDWWGQKWIDKIFERIGNSPDNGKNLLTALCPTMHENNNFIYLLSKPPFADYDKLHIFLIEYKFEHHAKLMIDNIITVGQHIPNANFIIINADQNFVNDTERRKAKLGQIRKELNKIFGYKSHPASQATI
jgi:2C-methyl-D-erythritol 2,4-cyclodiphosphate synthase